ncbi:MAG TPA: ankyrin repeat domain-containing protein [Opitutaceae bacterium]|nr:ankyrin repeat domain-containing protein [Opitutaceae bacterium]
MNLNRRKFLATSLVASVGLATSRLAGEEATKPPATSTKQVKPEPVRGARQDLDTVQAFVRAGHGQLEKVKEMIAQDPKLVFATWDWGGGDWETALGGASHVGSRECARYLLAQGARIDAFCAAMLGERAVVAELVAANPSVVTAKGPHGYTLLYHVAISGDVAMAEALRPRLPREAKDYSQALSAAVRDGHLEMTKWLFENGTVNPNVADALGKRPLTTALEKKFDAVAEELRRHGARETE